MDNSFYSQDELKMLGIYAIGENVSISRKASLYGVENISIGDNVRVDDFCILSGKIQIGNFVHIAAYTALYGGQDGIFVSDFANISARVCIYSISDDYSGASLTSPLVEDKYKNVISMPVKIEKHVIIGTGSVVLPGVILGEGSAFGSLSFIEHNSEEWSINVGIPFRKIKDRRKDILNLEKEMLN